MKMKMLVAAAVCLFLFSFGCYYFSKRHTSKKLDQCFFEVDTTFPFLNNIHERGVYEEIRMQLNKSKSGWIQWPEKELYDSPETKWTIFPFFGFGIWVEENLALFPNTIKFLKGIPGLKTAILSRLGPKTKLTPHKGWANHSNHVLRCHFGIKVPSHQCFIYVGEEDVSNNDMILYERKIHKENQWMIFDDSKFHYATNESKDEERVVLILDIERPSFVSTGRAEKGDTKELKELLNFFKQKIKIN